MSDARGVGAATSSGSTSAARDRGLELRERLIEPLRKRLEGAQSWVVVVDDVLHLVPLDAIPAEDAEAGSAGEVLLGDRVRIVTRATLTELLSSAPPGEAHAVLLAVGGVDFGDASALEEGPEPRNAPGSPRVERDAGILRGGAWDVGFADLPGSGVEAREVAGGFAAHKASGKEAILLEGSDATRDRFFEAAPRASWLHVATHGWFAPDSIQSWQDLEPIDRYSGLGRRASGEEQVSGMSPMLLCGLALSHANLPLDVVGRMPGLVTAEELSTLDLSRCELAVLSACDTNVGLRRAGQGVSSLQKALHMAGARTVITSLWKVPDEATKELMLDFYRRLWSEEKPKAQALWEAKKRLRDAKDERGHPRYSTRDWAAWVLTGDPN